MNDKKEKHKPLTWLEKSIFLLPILTIILELIFAICLMYGNDK